MAVDDRDWYKDALRKREAKEDARYYPKQFRGKRRPPPIPAYPRSDSEPPPPPPPERRVHWTLMLMFLIAVFIIATAIVRHLHR